MDTVQASENNLSSSRNRTIDKMHEIEATQDYLVIYLADQIFGIPVLQIQDVLGARDVTRVPLAPPEVSGSLNLRGRIVTAINVRKKLDLGDYEGDKDPLSVVVEHEGELYSLVIDRVGDVIGIKDKEVKETPPTLDDLWRSISNGIYRMEGNLLIVLDVAKLLDTVH
jgi:purine-binding chemotaxis protein CheW